MNLKDIGNTLKLPLGALGTVAGGAFTGISAYTLFFGGIISFLPDLGDWWWWVLIIAAAVLIAGAYYLGDAIWRRRKFRELVYNNKRSEFLKNEREINRLLSGLPRKYKDTVAERKRELKIKE
jgi:membrane protein implicated in regulation of membrane protease activity